MKLYLILSWLFLWTPTILAAEEMQGSIGPNADPAQTLTLRQAIEKALLHNPELATFSLEKRVREARTLQSGLFPNPQLEVEVEDATGSGKFGGFRQAQTTIQLSQLIELGGKRTSRIRAGSLSMKLAEWDYETKRMDVLTGVSKSFIDVLKAQQELALTDDLDRLGNQFLDTVSERVMAGKVARIEKTKAEVALAALQIEIQRTRQELENARRRLSSIWGVTRPQFASVAGDLFTISPIPPKEVLIDQVVQNPDLARWVTELEQRQAMLDLELSKRFPDIKLSGGYRRLEATNDDTLVFGFSLPLQLFNRNQGAIAAARHRLEKAREEQRTAKLKSMKSLLEAYSTLSFSNSQVISIRDQLLPGAEKAFEAINEGYRFGKFGYLDVLDSQKTLFEARGQYLQALAGYHKAVADVERLTGRPLVSVPAPAPGFNGEERQ